MTDLTVSIGSNDYYVYADQDAADIYAAAAIHATNWSAATADKKAQALATATRLLDRQTWLGEKTSSAQPLQWPRTNTGVTDVTDDVIPQAIIDASIELAIALVDGSDIQNQANVSQKEQSVRVGEISVSYFRGAEGGAIPGVAARFPQIVQELVSPFLGGNADSLVLGIRVNGADDTVKSVTENDFSTNRAL